jgi:hypothetical protein
MELGEWWTKFADENPEQRLNLLKTLPASNTPDHKPRRRRRRKPAAQ